jgi:hypothetical protein
MVILCRQRKESFIGDLHDIVGRLCGVLILTEKLMLYDVIKCSGMHSLFGILYGLKPTQMFADIRACY